jgi:hypothetical protein
MMEARNTPLELSVVAVVAAVVRKRSISSNEGPLSLQAGLSRSVISL